MTVLPGHLCGLWGRPLPRLHERQRPGAGEYTLAQVRRPLPAQGHNAGAGALTTPSSCRRTTVWAVTPPTGPSGDRPPLRTRALRTTGGHLLQCHQDLPGGEGAWPPPLPLQSCPEAPRASGLQTTAQGPDTQERLLSSGSGPPLEPPGEGPSCLIQPLGPGLWPLPPSLLP